MSRHALLFSILICLLPPAGAQEYPEPGWRDQVSPLAGADAYPGGEFSFGSGPFPRSFNYYLDTTVTSSHIFNLVYEKLLTVNGLTLEFEPSLAGSWSVSPDRRTFEFRLDERAPVERRRPRQRP